MTMPDKVEVNDETKDVLGALAQGDPDLLAAGLEVRADWKAKSGLDGRSYALVKLAALIALDAPPASYLWQVANALAAGATPADLVGVLIAVAPQVGGPRIRRIRTSASAIWNSSRLTSSSRRISSSRLISSSRRINSRRMSSHRRPRPRLHPSRRTWSISSTSWPRCTSK